LIKKEFQEDLRIIKGEDEAGKERTHCSFEENT